MSASLHVVACFDRIPKGIVVSCCISPPFGGLSTTQGEMTYVLLTRAPLYRGYPFLARLACVRRAANVRSEPGSNSPVRSGEGAIPRLRGIVLWLVRPHAEARELCDSMLDGPAFELKASSSKCTETHNNLNVRFSFQGPSGNWFPSRGPRH